MRKPIYTHRQSRIDRFEQRRIQQAAAAFDQLSLVAYLNILGLYPYTDDRLRLHYGPILPGHSGDLYIVPTENVYHIDVPPCSGTLTDFCHLFWDVPLATLVYQKTRFRLDILEHLTQPIP